MKIIDNNLWEEKFESLSNSEKRFVMQWVAEMETRKENGEDITSTAKETFLSIQETLGLSIPYGYFVPILKDTWAYGEELKEWQKNGFVSTGTDSKNDFIVISSHASKRLRERLGLNNSGQSRHVLKAYEKGLSEDTARGMIKNYFAQVKAKSNEDITVRIYNDKVYLFGILPSDNTKKILVTVLPLPVRCRKFMKCA